MQSVPDQSLGLDSILYRFTLMVHFSMSFGTLSREVLFC